MSKMERLINMERRLIAISGQVQLLRESVCEMMMEEIERGADENDKTEASVD